MRLLVLGQNPSKSNTDPNVAFKGSKSESKLNQWLNAVVPVDYECMIMNCSNSVDFKLTEDNLDIMIQRIDFVIKKENIDKIIALGNIPSKILKAAGIPHFKLPHPSGRNRLLNNKSWVAEQLQLAKEFLWNRA